MKGQENKARVLAKTTYKLALLLALGVSGVVFSAPLAHAQAPVIVVGQGQLPATKSYSVGQGNTYTMKIGRGYSGTTTSATVAAFFKINGDENTGSFSVAYTGYPTDQYVPGQEVTDSHCQWDSRDLPNDYDATNGLPVQLTFVLSDPDDCVMRPQYYYIVTVSMLNNSGQFVGGSLVQEGVSTNTKGWPVSTTASTTLALPYFVLIGPGFYIIPTTEDTGVLFSGAVDFCNDAFASTTGIGATFGNGACIAAGFLFIPTAASLAAFNNIPETITASFPFSWVVQMRDILESAQASSTENFVNLSINFGTSTAALGFTNLNVISTSTVSKYLSDSQRAAIKALLAAVFYLLAASFIYRSIQHIWQTS